MFETKRSRLALILVIVGLALASAALVGGVGSDRADAAADRVAARAERGFRGTTLDQVQLMFFESDAAEGRRRFESFMGRPGQACSAVAQDDGGIVAVYRIDTWGEKRIVRVRWTEAGVSVTRR